MRLRFETHANAHLRKNACGVDLHVDRHQDHGPVAGSRRELAICEM